MKTTKLITFSVLAVVFFCFAAISRAQDIDIYSNIGGTSNIPNLMFVVDSSANSDGTFGTCHYDVSALGDGLGATPSNTNKTLGNEQCALANIVRALSTKSDGTALINLGITTADGVYFKLTPIDDNTYTGTTPLPNGVVIAGGSTNRQAFIAAAKGLTKHTGSVLQGDQMQETWAYYTGGDGGKTNIGLISGVTFTGTTATTGCQKNYAAFLGTSDTNSHAGDGTSGQNANNSLGTAVAALTTSVDNAAGLGLITSAQQTLFKSNITTGATPDKYATPAKNTSDSIAREWARFMAGYDSNSSTNGTGLQNIVTYTVAIGGSNVDMQNFISDLATFSGGKPFNASSYADIVDSILKILNEVQAVNSVFSSSSLPVSVNTQGTYLNQVFMGMFRPDATGFPRWLGNLKQYQFIFKNPVNLNQNCFSDPTNCSLSLGDSTGAFAISSAGTGFISSNAVSFWTSKDTSKAPDSTGGFWVKTPDQVRGGYDSPDGEVVERGGAAQRIRMANLKDDYTATAGSSTNPRNLYSYCPSGSSCNTTLTDPSNAFALPNAYITAAMFGTSTTLNVTSIVRTGTSALVTTNGNHGFSAGTTVTISGATQPEYNITQAISAPISSNTFTITGLSDYPNTPSTGAYSATVTGTGVVSSISSVLVNPSTTLNANGCTSGTIPNINCNRVTVTTTLPHTFLANDSIAITGVSPSQYSGTFTIGNVTANTFTYNVSVTPNSPSKNVYSVQGAASTFTLATSVNSGNGNSHGTTTVTTTNAHGLTIGNTYTATISGVVNSNANPSATAYNGTGTITVTGTKTFTETFDTATGKSSPGTGGTVAVSAPVINIAAGNITRASVTATTATATGITASAFSNNQTLTLNYVSGGFSGEDAYVVINGSKSIVISCSGTCTSFTFSISTVPATTTLTTSSPLATKPATTVSIPIGSIARAGSGTTATATVANPFINGQSIDISVSGSAVATESAYVGTWPITCSPTPCATKFNFGPVSLTPATPATGTIKVTSTTSSPDRTSLVNWVRGDDNIPGDEAGPDTAQTIVNVRPSVHGDVLHSRPIVINYGGSIGIIAYYGSNDGVFRAVNGNQTANPSGSSLPAPGNELWGFIPTEFYGSLDRQRTNSPDLLLPTTPSGITPTPLTKDYFVDGATGVYQVINSSGVTTKAYVFLSMRRGGRLIYALDVTDPTTPKFLWKADSSSTDFGELGQTWSEPKVAFVKGYNDGATPPVLKPVLIFGAGYDPNEDSETLPAPADVMGRGIFIVDATTGAMIWSARNSCGGVTSACVAPTDLITHAPLMNYAIAADITLVDRDFNGVIDRLYAADLGGNIWRVDLEKSTSNFSPADWQIQKLAALGCNSGVCGSGVTPRKFFYRPDVIPTNTFDGVVAGTGDREHPLATSTNAYNVQNELYLLEDPATGNDGSATTTITRDATAPAGLVNETNATSTANWGTLSTTAQRNGYFIDLGTGEKAVNAPATIAGFSFIGTNQPAASNSCVANLGIAKGYTLSALTGVKTSVIFDTGGLPPSPVYGFVNLVGTNAAGVTVTKLVPFVIGAGNPDATCTGADCKSSIGSINPKINVSTSRKRTHWYIEKD